MLVTAIKKEAIKNDKIDKNDEYLRIYFTQVLCI